MLFFLLNLLEVVSLLVPILLCVAIMTIIERKVLASIQRRLGPNTVGWYGILQPFADALKLILKENLTPAAVDRPLFYIGPMISILASLLGWMVIPFGAGYAISDISLGVLFSIAVSSFGIYGVFLSGWASNNKFSFLGSLRSTAQMISYELILSSAILGIVLVCGSFHFITIIETQQSIYYIVPLFPFFIIFAVSALAELNRTPFDLVEAESELVSGYITEFSAVPFVFFFLAEYSSIVLISFLTAIYFLGGSHFPYLLPSSPINLESIVLGLKGLIFCFIVVLVRGTLPRLRYDQLINSMWTQFLPVAVALLIVLPSVLIAFDFAPTV